MHEQLKKDREMLKGGLAVFVILTAVFFSMAIYRSPIPPEVKPFLKGFLVAICAVLLMSAIYIYRVCQQSFSSWPFSLAMAILFAACGYKFGLMALIIPFVILWRTKKI